MKTSDVRIDVKLNKVVWSKGIRNVRFTRERARSMLARA
jgi:ribosomal protein L31E